METPDQAAELDKDEPEVDDTDIDDTAPEAELEGEEIDGAEENPIADLPSLADLKDTRPVTQDALRLYLREISKFPMLEPEEEFELARRVRDSNDTQAAFRLVSSHLRLVVKIAMDFQRRWMQNVLDLVQEGNVGLMRAVQKFDPEKGIKFSYYAAFWIKAYILKFIMDNWRMVKIGTTQAQRKLFYNLSKERRRLQTLGYDPDTATLSKNLNVTEEQVQEMEQRLGSNDMSLDVTLGEDSTTTRLDILPAIGPSIEDRLATAEISSALQEQLQSILPKLNEKERDILEKRLLADPPVTLREIGEKYGITRERVRQLESRLLEKLRDHLTQEIDDFSPDWIIRND
ncbi:RNA polymerase subunit sigma-70 [Oceanidesulfovibrio indonesiensis]|uniref:RNA polymerase sigma factor n=1 Tax=Oceanidesulfovibrio indonesiensis TaxID=54767 RepID=A0A7M3MGQ6_9BACT|nr:RNA polymerase factor sigma-32 [Oceanidesulfovibrio indonesiensis]TVM18496.1 RNA polymerase subunit sigma-70 [Oceanidesulfovibrio indonesiensis]